MSWIPQLTSGAFALAGAVLAAGPIVIHLLHRRQYNVLPWAAMDFLLEALQRHQRRIQLRNLLLLLLRCLAVLCFGLALAQPYFSSRAGAPLDDASPRHLILVIDNSLSMGYRPVSSSRLEMARQQATELLEQLPAGSQATIVPVCGTDDLPSATRNLQLAAQQLAAIPLADATASLQLATAHIRRHLRAAAPLPDQVVYFTDRQRLNDPARTARDALAGVPDVEIRDLSQAAWENSWIGQLQVRDEMISPGTTSVVTVNVHHQGPAARQSLLTLTVNGRNVASQNVSVPAGRSHQQVTLRCPFPDLALQPGSATFVTVQASLAPDRLAEDNQRLVVIPMAHALPIVLIDAVPDQQEDPAAGRLGETRPLRQLLTATTNQSALFTLNHVVPAEVTRSRLAAARAVVVAGLTDPSGLTDLLLQYADQGGPVIIAAGGSFDPDAWNQQAMALLPGPLAPAIWDVARDVPPATPWSPARIDVDAIGSSPLIHLPGVHEQGLRELYREPLFFQCLVVQPPHTQAGAGGRTPQGGPRWLAWDLPFSEQEADSQPSRSAATAIQSCLRLAEPPGHPLLISSPLGRGQVLFWATSILPTWNNMAQTNAVIMWDHALRHLVRSTLPSRNVVPQAELHVPLPTRCTASQVRVQYPEPLATAAVLDVSGMGGDDRSATVPQAWARGIYRLEPAAATEPTGDLSLSPTEAWQIELAANGPVAESDLSTQPIYRSEAQERTASDLVARSDRPTASPWWWLALGVLVLMLVELLLLALTTSGQSVGAQ